MSLKRGFTYPSIVPCRILISEYTEKFPATTSKSFRQPRRNYRTRVVHPTHVGVFDAQCQIQVRSLRFRTKCGLHLRRPTPHEPSCYTRASRAFFEMVAQVLELQPGAIEKYVIGRLCSLVDEANSAVGREALDFHFKCRLVGSFPGDFSSFLRHLFGRRRLCLLMEVTGVEAGKTKIVDHDLLNVRGVLDRTPRRKRSRPHGEFISFRDRLEIIQGDLPQLKIAFESDMRFGEKIYIALELYIALIKDNALQVNRRRVDAFCRLNIADVFGSKIELREVERFVRAFIYVREVAVANGEPVNLKWISRFQGVLPAFVLNGRWVLGFLDELSKVNMDFGIFDLKIANQSSKKERFPVNAGV